ncbi:hypothetical protein ACLKA6_005123 [Drosophila palustris]
MADKANRTHALGEREKERDADMDMDTDTDLDMNIDMDTDNCGTTRRLSDVLTPLCAPILLLLPTVHCALSTPMKLGALLANTRNSHAFYKRTKLHLV